MNRKALAWLYGQMPDLVAKGVLPAETAERIREYYGPLPPALGRWTLLTVFGLIGSVLLGLGIILILGHNWDKLDHLTRLLISLGLLLAAQVAAAFALWRKKDSMAWMEGTSIFLALAVGASVALVGQTYHLADDFTNYVLVWMLLSLPLVYLMDAKTVAGFYLIGVLVWLASISHSGVIKYAAWVLMALVLPYYRQLLKADRYRRSAIALSWLLLLCFYGCFGMTWNKQLWSLLYALLFSATYFVGVLWFGNAEKTWQKPFQVVGLLGGVGMAYILSFKIAWRHGPWLSVSYGEYLVAFGLIVLVAGLGILVIKRHVPRLGLIAALPAVVGAGYLLQSADKSGINAAVLMTLYLLGASISVIWKGVQQTRLGLLNTGMAMLAALILLRFLDFSYSFVVRGVAFILIGIAFLAVNVVMARRKDEVTK